MAVCADVRAAGRQAWAVQADVADEAQVAAMFARLDAEAVADAEQALEKSTATRGLLAVQHNEPDLYGYTDEIEDARKAFLAGKDAFLSWDYGLEITKLVMAGYLSSEERRSIDLTDPAVQKKLETYIPLIQQGKGKEVLHLL